MYLSTLLSIFYCTLLFIKKKAWILCSRQFKFYKDNSLLNVWLIGAFDNWNYFLFLWRLKIWQFIKRMGKRHFAATSLPVNTVSVKWLRLKISLVTYFTRKILWNFIKHMQHMDSRKSRKHSNHLTRQSPKNKSYFHAER